MLFNFIEHLAVLFVKLAIGGSRVDYLRFFCLHWITCLGITEDYFMPQSHKLNLTYRLKSFLFLTFCFLFVCMAGQNQMCFSSISPLGLFQGIICNIEKQKGGPWSPQLLGNLNWRMDLI